MAKQRPNNPKNKITPSEEAIQESKKIVKQLKKKIKEKQKKIRREITLCSVGE